MIIFYTIWSIKEYYLPRFEYKIFLQWSSFWWYKFFFLFFIQRVKTRAIQCPHLPPRNNHPWNILYLQRPYFVSPALHHRFSFGFNFLHCLKLFSVFIRCLLLPSKIPFILFEVVTTSILFPSAFILSFFLSFFAFFFI